jgi:transmembrane sensor
MVYSFRSEGMTEREFRELLDKFIEGRISPEEEKVLSEYEVFSLSEYKEGVFKSDIEKSEVKMDVYSKIKKHIVRKNRLWIGFAASVAILLGVGISVYFVNNQDISVVTNNSNSFRIVELKDGSIVTLNRNSSIRFNNDQNGIRYLELDGEAFFNIVRNEDKPFIVETEGLETSVLGTSFNISERDTLISVTVATGVVEVSYKNKTVKLKPNQRSTYSTTSKLFRTSNLNHRLFTSWYKNIIKLEGVSMGEVAEFLTYRYGVKVQFYNEKAKNNRMTISLGPTQNLQTILENINYINELKITKTKKNMIEVKLR